MSKPHPHKPATPHDAKTHDAKPAPRHTLAPAPELNTPAPLEPVEDLGTACGAERPSCPVCHVPGMEKLQKWFCPRCRRLLQTCCD